MVDEATDMAAFGGREKAVDVMDMRAVLFGSLVQNLALYQHLCHQPQSSDVG